MQKATFTVNAITFSLEHETLDGLFDLIEKAEKHEQTAAGEFEAETLVGSVLDGKVYWSIKGGQFRKYGVRVWDEVLAETGLKVKELNPAKTYSLKGKFKAQYAEKKVTKLIPIQN